jgi:hypothetical protein
MQQRKPENMSESESVNLLEEELTGTSAGRRKICRTADDDTIGWWLPKELRTNVVAAVTRN